jgi:chorismate mutase
VLKPISFPKILYPNNVNVNPSILSFYTRQIVPRITKSATLTLAASKRANGITGDAEYEDDGNYGSASTIDIEVLQAVSKRVHYGKQYIYIYISAHLSSLSPPHLIHIFAFVACFKYI